MKKVGWPTLSYWAAVATLTLQAAAASDHSIRSEPSFIRALQQRRDAAVLSCLSKRTNSQNLNPMTGCAHESPENNQLKSLKRAFCSDAASYCDAIEKLHASDDLSLTMNSRCEPAIEIKKPLISKTNNPTSTLGFAALGCDDTARFVVREVSPDKRGWSVEIAEEKRCLSNQLPFPCSKPTRLSGRSVSSNESYLSELIDRYNIELTPVDGKYCRIRAGYWRFPKDSPKPSANLISLDAYVEEFKKKLGDPLPQNTQSTLENNELVPHAPFEHGLFHLVDEDRWLVQAAYTPERTERLRRAFHASMDGLVEALKLMNPPAPPAIIRRVQSIQLYEPKSEEDIKKIAQECSGFLSDHFTSNAFYSPKDNHLLVCPNLLMTADLSSMDQLTFVISHELGHSIDANTLGLSLYDQVKAHGCSEPHTQEFQEAKAFLRRSQSFASCLAKKNPASGVVKAQPQVYSKAFDILAHSNIGYSKKDLARFKCSARQFLSDAQGNPGLLQQVSGDIESLLEADQVRILRADKPEARAIYRKLSDVFNGKTSDPNLGTESTADYFGGLAFSRVQVRPLEERESREWDMLMAASGLCALKDDEHTPSSDSHSAWKFRFATFSSLAKLPQKLGCVMGSKRAQSDPAEKYPKGCQF